MDPRTSPEAFLPNRGGVYGHDRTIHRTGEINVMAADAVKMEVVAVELRPVADETFLGSRSTEG